jgi:hypothetical protein
VGTSARAARIGVTDEPRALGLTSAMTDAMRTSLGIAVFALAAAACRDSSTENESRKNANDPPKVETTSRAGALPAAKASASSASSAAVGSLTAPAHIVPAGTVAGKAFTPDVVILNEASAGAKLGFYQRKDERKKRERWRCEEPLIDADTEVTAYRKADDWKPGSKVEIPLEDFGITGVDFGAKPKGKAIITIAKRDAATFRVEGSIELSSDDGAFKLSGPFAGDYCPMKGVARETPEPLAGMAWSLDPMSPDKVVKTPIASIIAGEPAPIAHVTVRERKRLDKLVTEIVFFRDMPPDACSERPAGGWMTTYKDDGRIAMRDGPKFRDDSFAIYLAAAPKAGDKIAGMKNGSKEDAKDIVDADLQAFEADGYRSWSYAQYFSAALVVDEADDKAMKGRVYLALPDIGKSELAGAFSAVRCPPLE